jgi:hypothetical protein
LPTAKNSSPSCCTPFGARRTGGFILAPTGSLAKVASAQASNQPAGISAAFLS